MFGHGPVKLSFLFYQAYLARNRIDLFSITFSYLGQTLGILIILFDDGLHIPKSSLCPAAAPSSEHSSSGDLTRISRYE